jgi:hypothetical protein
MSHMVHRALDESHPVRGDANRENPKARMVKADLPKRENRSEREKKEAYGRLLKTVQHVLGYNRDQMANLLDVDARQLGRWYSGDESPQMWRYHDIPKVRRALRLVEALDDCEGATVVTQITSRLDIGVGE